MPVQINWYTLDRTIISLRADRCNDWQTLFNARADLISLLSTVPHEVDIIAQLGNACLIKSEGLNNHIPMLLNGLPPNLGLVVVMGNQLAWDVYLHACANVHNLMHIDAEFANSLEQAHDLICNRQMSRLYSRHQA